MSKTPSTTLDQNEWDFYGITPEFAARATLWEYLRECPRWVAFVKAIQSKKVNGKTVQEHMRKHEFLNIFSPPQGLEFLVDLNFAKLKGPAWELFTTTTIYKDFPKASRGGTFLKTEPLPAVAFTPADTLINAAEKYRADEKWELAKGLLKGTHILRMRWGENSLDEMVESFKRSLQIEAKKHPRVKAGRPAHTIGLADLRNLAAWRLKRAGYSFDKAARMIETTVSGAASKIMEQKHAKGTCVYPIWSAPDKWYQACKRASALIAKLNKEAPNSIF